MNLKLSYITTNMTTPLSTPQNTAVSSPTNTPNFMNNRSEPNLEQIQRLIGNGMIAGMSIVDDMTQAFATQLAQYQNLQNNDSESTWTPAHNIYNYPERIIIDVFLPGVQLADIRINFRTNKIVVTGTRTNRTTRNDVIRGIFTYTQAPGGTFRKDIPLPLPVTRSDAVQTNFDNCILSILIDKSVEIQDHFVIEPSRTTPAPTPIESVPPPHLADTA